MNKPNQGDTPTFSSTLVLFGFSFLTSSSYVLTTSLGASLYIARVGANSLPFVLAISAVVVVLVSLLTYAVIGRLGIRTCLWGSWLALAASTFLAAQAITEHHHWVVLLAGLYVLAEVRGCLNSVYLTTFLTDTFKRSSTSRPYTLVHAGAPLAGIVTGFILSSGASAVSAEMLLMLIFGVDLATLVLGIWMPNRRDRQKTKSIERSGTDVDTTPKMAKQQTLIYRYRFRLSGLVAMKVLVLTLIGFHWKVAVSEYLHESETELLAYFAAFYAVSDGLILLVQFFVAGKLLDRFGLGFVLKGYPLLLMAIGAAILMSSKIGVLVIWFTLARGLDVVRRGIHDPALSISFAVMRKDLRRRSIVGITGILKPLFEVITAISLLLYEGNISYPLLTTLWCLLLIPWLGFAFAAVNHHRKITNLEIDVR